MALIDTKMVILSIALAIQTSVLGYKFGLYIAPYKTYNCKSTFGYSDVIIPIMAAIVFFTLFTI